MYVNERQSRIDIAEQLRQKEQRVLRQGATLGGELADANQIRDRPELEREMERLEKACAHVSGLVAQLEHRLSSVLVPRPENSGAGHADINAGSALGQAIRSQTYALDSTAARLLALMDSLAL